MTKEEIIQNNIYLSHKDFFHGPVEMLLLNVNVLSAFKTAGSLSLCGGTFLLLWSGHPMP